MSKTVGAVTFSDGSSLYLVFDEMLNAALRPLFPTENAARDWMQSGAKTQPEPKEAILSEETVTLMIDLTLESDPKLAAAARFASRASRKAMWLTGPRSFLEMAYENGATASREF
ncbi:MAG: hypothetical protein C4516_03690 [Oxalobacter sp.]|nr:MAG: hypothetical protein C4516_03690 [Oxalobacter sp.]